MQNPVPQQQLVLSGKLGKKAKNGQQFSMPAVQ